MTVKFMKVELTWNLNFTWKIYLNLVTGIKTYIWKVRYKSLFERQKTRFICKFWSISMLPDPHSNTDPYPRHQNECGSRWIRIRIHNTVFFYPEGCLMTVKFMKVEITWSFVQVMFEHYGFDSAYVAIQAVLTLYAQGLLTGELAN